MIYIATTISDQKVNLGYAYSAQINKSFETPADCLNVIFPSNKKHEEYKNIDVYINENEKFFSGVVDEQRLEVTSSGCFLTIIARNKAAYLIDNEASPQDYTRPSLDIIFKRHVKPYGFTAIYGDLSVFSTIIEVTKGMSEWDVLEKFCSTCLNIFPTVNADGTIDATGSASFKKLYFSNVKGAVNYSSFVEKNYRYRLISEIIVCAPYEAIYIAKVKDQNLIDKGISRRKFISISADNDHAEKYSISTAEQMISNAKKKAHEIIITCPGAIFAQVGNKCEIDDSILGKVENLEVYEVEYKLNRNGEFTVITLLEE